VPIIGMQSSCHLWTGGPAHVKSARCYVPVCVLSGFAFFFPLYLAAQTPPSPDDADVQNQKAHAWLDRAVRVNGLTVDGSQP
jgi:hypothetical protein